jgi:hypothetical protein
MCQDLGVGMQGKALHAGTAGTSKCWGLALIAKPRADAPDLLASPLPKGDALLHGGHHGTGELLQPGGARLSLVLDMRRHMR